MVCLTTFISCKKDSTLQDESSTSLLKVVQTNSSYMARSVIEMSDGSIVLISISNVTGTTSSFDFPDTQLPAIISKYDANGNLLWQNELPEIVQTVWHAIALASGDIAIAGFDKAGVSTFMGLIVINSFGELINQTTLYNPLFIINMNAGILNRLDMIQLQNGNIAVVLNFQLSGSPSCPRLLIYSPQLSKIYDNTFLPSTLIPFGFSSQIYLLEDALGDIIMHGRFTKNNTSNFAFDLKVQADSYTPIYHQTFIDTLNSTSSSMALSNAGSCVWTSAGSRKIDTLFTSWFNYRYQEYYKIAPTIKVWMSNGSSDQTQNASISGYPKNGYIGKVKKCKGGGYILLGTCNINSNQQIPSNYQIMLIKITDDLRLEWIQYPNTYSPSVASDVVETNNGYLVSATQLSFGETSRPIIFKTNKQGIIK